MIWCWEYVSGISDLAQLRIFYKLSRFGGWLWGSTCLAAQDSLVCKFPLLIQTATSPLGVTWLFLWSLPTLHVWGPNFRLYPGSSPKGREPTLCIPTFNTQVKGSTMEERTRQPSRWNGLVGWCQCLSSAFPVLAQHSHDVREEGYIYMVPAVCTLNAYLHFRPRHPVYGYMRSTDPNAYHTILDLPSGWEGWNALLKIKLKHQLEAKTL